MLEIVYVVLMKITAVVCSVLSFFYILFCSFWTLNLSDMSDAGDDVDLPAIYVDKEILDQGLMSRTALPVTEDSRGFLVNDEVFYEQTPADSLAEFEVYKMMGDDDVYCSTPESESDSGDQQNTELSISLQPAPNGYIVNGSCYLSCKQWNTLVAPSVSINLLHCVACGSYCESGNADEHTASAIHRLALQAAPPLERFDLSVTRRIRNLYHCAVCNESFNVSAENEHYSSKTHEGNLLFSINKASDLLDNSMELNNNGDDKVDTYHFKTHSMNSPRNSSGSFSREYNDNYSFLNFQNTDYFEEYEEEEQPMFTGLSYATMAKKPKAKTQTFIDVDLGSKKVTVKFDSFNMIVNLPKSNEMWCMVCKKYERLRNKSEHCAEPDHIKNLNKCRVVESYEEYFIRQVDDKLYHCGHCNNLSLIHEMNYHVESEHPRKKQGTDSKNIDSAAKNDKQTDANGAKNDANNRYTDNDVMNKDSVKKSTDSVMKSTDSAMKSTDSVKKSTTSDMKSPDSVVKSTNNFMKNTDSVAKSIFNDKNYDNAIIKASSIKNANTIKNMNSVTNKTDSATQNTDSVKKDINIDSTENTPINSPKKVLPKFMQNLQNSPVKSNNNNLTHKIPDIFDPMTIYPFGSKITILSLAFNVCCQRPGDFYCGLCDVKCLENSISRHVFELSHLELLQRTPFIEPFKNNLIRAIRDALHCTICNIPVPASVIYKHLEDPQHVDKLNIALNQPKLPPIGVKIPNVPITLPTGVRTPNSSAATPNISPNSANLRNITNNMAPQPVQHNNLLTPNRNPFINQSASVPNNGRPITKNAGLVIPINVGANTNIRPANTVQQFHNNNVGNLNNTGPQYYGVQNVPPPNISQGMVANNNNIRSYNGHPYFNTNNSGPTSNIAPFNNKVFNQQTVFNNEIPHNIANIKRNTNDETKNTNTQIETEEFIDALSNDDKEEYFDETDSEEEINRTFDSVASEDAAFDLEEEVYLKLKNTYIKIANSSYNTLVHVGDGSKYCFVCSVNIQFMELQKHVDSREHMENMDKYMFVDKYEDHFLRQIYVMYHCAICNVIVSRKELRSHLVWPTHTLQNVTLKNIKKTRKTEIKGGVKQIVVSTQKESIYLHDNEPKIKISLNVQICDKMVPKVEEKKQILPDPGFSKKNKIIIFNDNVLKISWDSWHSISRIKSGVKCVVCQRALAGAEVHTHCCSEWHRYGLEKPFEKQYAPALIRKINDSTLNCLVCNTEISNKEHLVQVHVTGKKHMKNYEDILKDSSQANTYTDCNDDVLML